MPEYLAPGVYVEEISSGAKPIEGVGTSTAGFVGGAERGPETPRLIASFLEYQRWYGGYVPQQSYLAYAVQGFFDNGGQRCFISRVTHLGGGNPANTATLAGGAVGPFNVFAVGRGSWANNVAIKIVPIPETPPLARVFVIYYRNRPDPFVDPTDPANALNRDRRPPDYTEVYDGVTHIPGASNNVLKVVNSASKLVRINFSAPPAPLPQVAFGFLAGGLDGGALTTPDFVGGEAPVLPSSVLDDPIYQNGTGLTALANVDEIAILAAPDDVNVGQPLVDELINQCERLKDRFAVVSVAQGNQDVSPVRPPRDSTYAAFYYPWIRVYDPSDNQPRLIPPTGHMVGIYARSDIERGVHKAPANEVVRGALDLEFPVTKAMQDILNPRGVNCIRDFRADRRGIRLWGARTMSSDPEWRYVNVRRLFLFIEESIDEGTQWVVFEPNYDETWRRVTRVITSFLTRVWRSGALMGNTQEEAFFVKCDRTTMTQDDIDNGRLICYIGVAPVKPAEFVIFRVSQKTSEAPS